MWFVTNKTNCIKLKKFEKKVIISKLAIGTPSTNQQIHTDRPPLNCRDLLQKTA